jgi:hypothetical protein
MMAQDCADANRRAVTDLPGGVKEVVAHLFAPGLKGPLLSVSDDVVNVHSGLHYNLKTATVELKIGTVERCCIEPYLVAVGLIGDVHSSTTG